MKGFYCIVLLSALLLVSCATNERDVRISVRDAGTKRAVEGGTLILNQSRFLTWYFSLDPIKGRKYMIGNDGTALIGRMKDVQWSMKAEVKGYDRGVATFSLPEPGAPGSGGWTIMSNERHEYPNFPNKYLEYSVEIPDAPKPGG